MKVNQERSKWWRHTDHLLPKYLRLDDQEMDASVTEGTDDSKMKGNNTLN